MFEPAPLPVSQLRLDPIKQLEREVVRVLVDLGIREADLCDVGFVLLGLFRVFRFLSLRFGDALLLNRHGSLLVGFDFLLLGNSLLLDCRSALFIGFNFLLFGNSLLLNRDGPLLVGLGLLLLGNAALLNRNSFLL